MGKKGGNTTTTNNNYDPVYSAKMAEIAERQQAMAEEQWGMYKDYFQNYEIEVAKTNQDLLPYLSESTKEQLRYQDEAARANRELLPAATALNKAELEAQKPVAEKFYKEALEGVDVGERMDQAGNEVKAQTKLGGEIRRREMSRYGIDPGSSTFATAENTAALETAKGVAGARTKAKTEAETENFNRLGVALGKNVSPIVGQGAVTTVNNADPAQRAANTMSGAAASYAPLATRVMSSATTKPPTTFLDVLGNVLGQGAGAYAGANGAKMGGQ